ncbi:LysR family transcriptional regulator [Pseudovibrio sp. SPO723]|uniref:LysR family transcriptional regulator n=1 Tax=Nesiotobacter zosterae TaxID=392721 RepID=UPI0029C122FB|nr:LysR family transcriptional regulator [Pseudovibrio sp. SPO723]MDX5593260.1 LysR family transcriptional regulator [Pseudovibrio sp. SPO723]
MEIYQLKTFVSVAREGSITRASEKLNLSQPAVSAHIKAIEETLGLEVFERTARGMVLTNAGARLLIKAEATLSVHQDLIAEASRIKGSITGKLRIGAGDVSNAEAVGRLLTQLAQRCPEVEVELQHGFGPSVLNGIKDGSLDAGIFNRSHADDPDLTTVEMSHFNVYLAAPKGSGFTPGKPDWARLADMQWICPASNTCCGRTAENLFAAHNIQPKRIISIDRESVTRTLVAGGVGVGLLHADTAKEAEENGEVELVYQTPTHVRVLFAHLKSRHNDPLLQIARGLAQDSAHAPAAGKAEPY